MLVESKLLARRGHTAAFDFAEIGTIRWQSVREGYTRSLALCRAALLNFAAKQIGWCAAVTSVAVTIDPASREAGDCE